MNKFKSVFLLLIFLVTFQKQMAQSAGKKAISAKEIVENNNKISSEFNTVSINSKVKYTDEKQSQNITAEIKIKKNEIILVNLRYLGLISLGKALITPTSVKYYEKLGNTYFEGDYTTLSNWLGADLDFYKIQNMFLGKPIDDLTKENYDLIIIEKQYELKKIDSTLAEKNFYFDENTFELKKQEIKQEQQKRSLQINYQESKKYPEMILPLFIIIDALQEKGNIGIEIEYKNANFNEELTFPYVVPEGYNQIFIK